MSREFRDALGCFVTGVCIVTCRTIDGEPHGVTVNSFSSVSLDPPLVLFSLDRANTSFGHFHRAETFVIHVLSRGQEALSRTFARIDANRFAGVAFDAAASGAPVLPGSLATFECRKYATYDGGDHEIIVGRVVGHAITEDEEALLFFRGRYRKLLHERTD